MNKLLQQRINQRNRAQFGRILFRKTQYSPTIITKGYSNERRLFSFVNLPWIEIQNNNI
ncbi:hypothetical protein pb186bvf_014717 [Paramecium bursaria]